MKTRYFILLAFLTGTIAFFLPGCNQNTPRSITVAFYNVENLFDTTNDEGVRDGDFTPEGKIVWDSEKYNKKLKDLTRVITAIDSADLPLIIGLAEVENLGVLRDLTSKTRLNEGNYGIIHFDSPDERGIDVALLYRNQYFMPIHARPYPLIFPFDENDRTRDMLYVKGVVAKKDTLHLLVNHWPSRSGGKEKSDPKRREAAISARQVVDSIFRFNPSANIIIMGDLNDNPTDDNVLNALNAKRITGNIENQEIYNLSIDKFEDGEGTLYWRSWDLFDQMIVSGNILKGNTFYQIEPEGMQILKEDWMLYERKDGVKVPNRMAGRTQYYGGFSDHLPVYIRFSQ